MERRNFFKWLLVQVLVSSFSHSPVGFSNARENQHCTIAFLSDLVRIIKTLPGTRIALLSRAGKIHKNYFLLSTRISRLKLNHLTKIIHMWSISISAVATKFSDEQENSTNVKLFSLEIYDVYKFSIELPSWVWIIYICLISSDRWPLLIDSHLGWVNGFETMIETS